MKKHFILLVALLVSSLAFAQSVWNGFYEPWVQGTGTEDDPFLIENAQQLAYLAYRVNNGFDAGSTHVSNPDYHYRLMTDINLNGTESFQWTPIGYQISATDYQRFGGHFDGNGYTISGLYVDTESECVGLFGSSEEATFSNLNVVGIKVATSRIYAGAIVGWARNIVLANCSGRVTVGVSSTQYAGGLVGYVEADAVVTDCSHTGSVSSSSTVDYSCAGGLLGCVNGSLSIINSHKSGDVLASSDHDSASGGIVGRVGGHSTISRCYYDNGNVSASNFSESRYSNSISGGIIGNPAGTSIINYCYNKGNVSSSASGNYYYRDRFAFGGGIVGRADNLVHVFNSYYSKGEASVISENSGGSSLVGGVLGWCNNSVEIKNCYNTGSLSVSGSAPNKHVGGISGFSNNQAINSYYLSTCGGYNTYGGQPMSSDAMLSAEFVTMLNDGVLSYQQDVRPYQNQGYPIFSDFRVETLPATDIAYYTATLNGNYSTHNQEQVVIAQGFEYKLSTDEDYTRVFCTSEQNPFSFSLSGLICDTAYVYRAFTTVAEGTAYGELCSFHTTLPPRYTITASASAGGVISPSGEVVVNEGENVTFTVTPNENYAIEALLVDGVSVGTISTYTFQNVTRDHAIEAVFRSTIHHIHAFASGHGTISPSGEVEVTDGQNKTFTITPDAGFEIGSLIVDNDTVEPVTSYTFRNITSDHSISVNFVEMTGPCLPPMNLLASVINSTSVRISWQGGADIYLIVYGIDGAYNHAVSTSENSLVIEGLVPHSNYEWKIKSVCGELETGYVNGQPFTTSGQGVDENNGSFCLWPNPVKDHLTISGRSISEVALYNTVGQQLMLIECFGETTTIDVTNFNSGIYLVKVTDIDGKSGFSKVIIE